MSDAATTGTAIAAQIEMAAAAFRGEPSSLLALSEIYYQFGYPKTAALLRRCADRVMSQPVPVGFPVVLNSTWLRADGQLGASITLPPKALDLARSGAAIGLFSLPAASPEVEG